MKFTRYVFHVVQIRGQTIHYDAESFFSYAENLLSFVSFHKLKEEDRHAGIMHIMELAVGSYVRIT